MADYVDRYWTSSDGLRLYARSYAAAPGPFRLPVVCIHGLTRNSADFEALAPRLAQGGRRVIAIDVRGRGRSERARDPMTYQPAMYAADVAALFDQAGLERAIFIGTSMGGLITMTLAATHADLIAGTVLNDVGPELDPRGLARVAAYAGEPSDAADWDAAAAFARKINGVAFPHYTDADWLSFARRIYRDKPGGGLELAYDPDIAVPIRVAGQAALVPDLWPFFEGLAEAAPMLLVRGATSDLLSAEIADRMQARAPSMRRVDVPGVGHAPMLDEPEAVGAIERFLGELP
ncbi:alpha/beta hydrolase [Brevundimonas sp. 2R-24]|uniref:Alpha/beta hydrolase n=1 Tax=Peiella sedimenti TaxID=3061083 RepID=A0ABT8SKS9_9CAUL|nr:alpha/beta hydrolase [Caulobacteraceae bacterium XZ-24]